MAAIIYGKSDIPFGVQEPKPLRGFPPGRVKIRLRHDDFAQAFVKTTNGIRRFHIKEEDGFWEPLAEMESNHRQS